MANLYFKTVLDSNGDPVSGAKAFFYQQGTTTPQTAYVDVGLTTPAPNPIIADSAGNIIAYLDDQLSYTVVVKDANDVSLNIDADFPAASTLASVQAAAASAAAASDDADDAEAARVAADSAKTAAETARDAAILNGINYYADTTAGLADTTSGDYFAVPDTTDNEIDLYLNNSGSADLVDSYPAASKIDDGIATVDGIIDELLEELEVGRPSSASLVTGANPSSNYRVYAQSGGVKAGMKIAAVRLFAKATGTLGISFWSRAGNALTRETDTVTINIDATGEQTIDTSALNIVAPSDDLLIGWLPSSSSVVPQITATADLGGSYRTSTSGDVTTFNDPTPDTYQMQIGFDLTLQTVTNDSFAALQAEDARLAKHEFPLGRERFKPLELRGEASINALLSRVQELEGKVKALENVVNVYYVDPTATGAGNGSSWSDAFTTLGQVAAVLVPGDYVFTNAPFATPLPTFSDDWVDDVHIVGDNGPDGETWVRGDLRATWIDNGDGRFYTDDLTSEPRYVGYDMKQDTDGSVTGMDWTEPSWVRLLRISGFSASQVAPYYGFLHQESDHTSLAVGDWAWESGATRLWIRPSGSPSVSDVNAKAVYSDGRSGINIRTASGTGTLSGSINGFKFFFFPADSDGEGYGFRNRFAKFYTARRNEYHVCGYHGVGFAGLSQTNNTIADSVFNGCAGGIPIVFFTNVQDFADAGHVVDNVINSYAPYLDINGQPLAPTVWTSARTVFTHTNTTVTMDGLRCSRVYQLDPFKTILDHHSLTVPAAPVGSLSIGIRNGTHDADTLNASGYSAQCTDSIFLGGGSGPEVQCWFENCEFDSLGEPQSGFSFATQSLVWKIGLKDCRWVSNYAAAIFSPLRDGVGGVALIGNDIQLNGAGPLTNFTEDESADQLYLRDNQIDSSSNALITLIANTMSLSDITTANSIVSGGGNAFGAGIQGDVIQRANGTSIATAAEFVAAFDPASGEDLASAALNLS